MHLSSNRAPKDYRAILQQFYAVHNPSKQLADIDIILESFAGDEESMMQSMYEKYNVSPPPAILPARSPSNVVVVDDGQESAALGGFVGSATSAAPGTSAVDEHSQGNPQVVLSKSPRRARSAAVSSRGGVDTAVAAVQRTTDGTRASLTHVYHRLQTLLASMVQVDPTEMFLSEEWMGEGGMPPHVARGGVDDMLATILRDVSRFKSLAAEFVEECGPMIDMIDATRPDARRSELESAASRTVVMESHEEEPSLVEGSIVILPPHRSTLGRDDTCVITKRLASLSLSPLAKVVLHPGVYTERVALSEGSTVELRGSYVGASITLQQFRSHLEDHDGEQEAPIISLESGSTIRCYGMRFESTDTAAASTSSPSAAGYNGGGGDGGEPLIRVSGAGCSAEFVNCVFESTSIGVFVEGVGATARFVDCTFRHCSYAGIYAKHGSHVVLEGCTFTRNGSSLRCRAATFSLSRCIVKQSTSDALITHGTVEGVVEDCTFEEGPENGMLVSPSTALSIHSTRFSAFRMFGVYAAKGSDVKLLHCTFLDNGLGSLNTSVPGHHRV